jgi:hypothetical protein
MEINHKDILSNICKLYNSNEGILYDFNIVVDVDNIYSNYATINFIIKIKPEHIGTTFNFIFYQPTNIVNETSYLIQNRLNNNLHSYTNFFLLKKPNKYTCKELINSLKEDSKLYSLFQTYVITKNLNVDYNNVIVLTISGWFKDDILNTLIKCQ